MSHNHGRFTIHCIAVNLQGILMYCPVPFMCPLTYQRINNNNFCQEICDDAHIFLDAQSTNETTTKCFYNV
jgi:hypothetical protein